jgi:hypothetical protein
MRTSDSHTSAHTALREATQALSVRRDGTTHGALTETGYEVLAADLARTLDAAASLLRSVGVGVNPSAARGLLTMAGHLDIGALMARQAGGDHADRPPVPTMRLDPERCATTDS